MLQRGPSSFSCKLRLNQRRVPTLDGDRAAKSRALGESKAGAEPTHLALTQGCQPTRVGLGMLGRVRHAEGFEMLSESPRDRSRRAQVISRRSRERVTAGHGVETRLSRIFHTRLKREQQGSFVASAQARGDANVRRPNLPDCRRPAQ